MFFISRFRRRTSTFKRQILLILLTKYLFQPLLGPINESKRRRNQEIQGWWCLKSLITQKYLGIHFTSKNICINMQIRAKPSNLTFHLRLTALMKLLDANFYSPVMSVWSNINYWDFTTSRMKKKHVKRLPFDLDLTLQMHPRVD